MDTHILMFAVVGLTSGMVIGAGLLYLYRQVSDEKKKDAAQKEAERIVNRAKSQIVKIEKDAKNRAKDFENRARRNAENEIKKQKQKLQNEEQGLREKEDQLHKEFKRKEEALAHKLKTLDDREERLSIIEKRIKEAEDEARRNIEELQEKLQTAAQLSREEALAEMRKALEDEAREKAAPEIHAIEEEARKEATQKARHILASAIARYASEVATERTVSIVPLTSDEMKGKIIGREGRNIRAMEAACGVDLIVDETPESVVISCFDPVRREIAKRALEKLMEDGRVHPARIEEVVSKVKSELFNTIREDGEKACVDLGVTGVHPNIQNLIGHLKYRHIGNQNAYDHSLQVAYISGLLAGEAGGDVKSARRVGLLHAIGHAIDHTVEGSYSSVGADYARRHGEKDHICQAIRAVTGETEAKSVLDHVAQAAKNLAMARPGAKRPMIESYIRRLEDLESIGNSFDGVQRTFALQAGKEIRVLVDSGKVTDEQSQMLSRDIARKIERELNYPGQVKVMVVRETRIVEHAR